MAKGRKMTKVANTEFVAVQVKGAAVQQLEQRSEEMAMRQSRVMARLFEFFCQQDEKVQWRMMGPPSPETDREILRMMLGKRGK